MSVFNARAGGNRPLLFVIARGRRRRGNLARAQDPLRVIVPGSEDTSRLLFKQATTSGSYMDFGSTMVISILQPGGSSFFLDGMSQSVYYSLTEHRHIFSGKVVSNSAVK